MAWSTGKKVGQWNIIQDSVRLERFNKARKYAISGAVVNEVEEQRVLEICLQSLKGSRIHQEDDYNDRKMNCFMNQGTEYESWDVMVKLRKTLVRLQLEKCTQF